MHAQKQQHKAEDIQEKYQKLVKEIKNLTPEDLREFANKKEHEKNLPQKKRDRGFER